jgi:hypothetical protein
MKELLVIQPRDTSAYGLDLGYQEERGAPGALTTLARIWGPQGAWVRPPTTSILIRRART